MRLVLLVAMSEATAERPRLAGQNRLQLLDPRRRHAQRRTGDAERGDHLAAARPAPAPRSPPARPRARRSTSQSRRGGRPAARGSSRRRELAARSPAWQRSAGQRRPNATNTLPMAECSGSPPTARATARRRGSAGCRPGRGARRRRAPGTGEVDRLAAGLGERVERGLAQLDEVALEHAALGYAEDRRAGAQPPALSVLLDQAAALERADAGARRCSWAARRPRQVGQRRPARSLSSTRTSRSAPRSTAAVP